MENDENWEGCEGSKAAGEEARAPGDDDDGVVGDSYDGYNDDDHEIAEESEAGA